MNLRNDDVGEITLTLAPGHFKCMMEIDEEKTQIYNILIFNNLIQF